MKKMRKFAEGGYETAEGENENIKEDTRSRARKFIEDGSPEQDTGEKPVTKAKTSVTASKPKADDSSEKDRMEKRLKEQALERVEPENYLPGTGLLKGLLKGAVRSVEKDVARTVTNKAGKEIPVKQGTPKTSSPSEAESLKFEADQLKRRSSINDVAEKRLRTRNKNNEGSESVRERASKLGMKSGGSVKSSQMSKANGIAQRGLTRGKMC
jgi:hypothetical protein